MDLDTLAEKAIRSMACRLTATASLAVAIGLPHAGLAQERQLEEILVTAQKKSESLQDVPISISVLGADELAELAIFDFTETARLTPGVDMFPGVQSAAIRLRGVGPAFFALTSPQSVTVFVDEMAQASVGSVFSTLVDVERIELLRGPQGTLYGTNAPGGAYNISTRAPNVEEFEGYIEGSYSQYEYSDLETVDLRGAVNVPLIENTLGWRLAAVYADSDGFAKVKNPVNSEKGAGGKEHQSFRSRLLWVINPEMDLTWNVNYQDLDDEPLDLFNVDGVVPGTGGDSGVPAITNRFEDRHYYADFNSEAETDLRDTSLHWRWQADVANIDFLAYYQDFDTSLFDNRVPYPGFDETFDITLDWELKTVELRFSDTGEKFDYLAGLYYLDGEIDGGLDLVLNGVALDGPVSGTQETYAAYGNMTFHLAEKWDFSAGLRYEQSDLTTYSDLNFLQFKAVVDDDEDYDHLSWSLKLLHYVNENHNAYLAVDNAYKRGGFNNLTPGAAILAPIFPEVAAAGEQMLAFDEETSTAYEVGFKGQGLDGTLGYSLAIFYQEFDDHQVTQPLRVDALVTPAGNLNALFQNQLTNADEVVTQGIELELNYLLGELWTVDWRLAYFDATIEEWDFRFCGQGEEEVDGQLYCSADSGDPLNALPQWNSNFQLGHRQPLTPSINLYGRFDWTWQSSANFTRVTDRWDDSKSRFDLSVGLQFVEYDLDLRVWGKNLADEDFNINPVILPRGNPAPYEGTYYRGREYGMTLTYSF